MARAHVVLTALLANLLVLSGASCASLSGLGGGTVAFSDVAALEAGAKVPADAPAVVLLREEVIHVRGVRGVAAPITEFHHHEVVKIVSEAGFEAAKMRVAIPPEGELVQLAARTVAPDGKVTPVDPRSMQKARTVVEGSAGVELRYFQFPNVEVGSVLEIVTVTRTKALFLSWASVASSPFPIATYRADVSTPSNVTFDFLLNGTQAPLEQVPDPDGRQRVVVELKDVPAMADEVFAPQERTAAPWWIYRITELRSAKGGAEPGLIAWDRAVPWVIYENVVEQKPIAGFAKLDAGKCHGDVKCLVTEALAQARTREWTGFTEQLEMRDPEEIEQSGTANNLEKALLFWSLLRSADVEAHLALLARTPGFPVNKTFPSPAWFDHAVVLVPGLGDTFVDPSCEACAPGQLPEWDRDVEALVVRPRSDHWRIDTEWKPVAGQALPDNEHRVVYDATVHKTGDVEVSLEEIVTGETAMLTRLETRLADEAEVAHEWDHFAGARSRSARVTTSTAWSCERDQARCRRTATLTIPGYGAVDGDRILVPLGLLHSSLEDAIPPDTDVKRRHGDVEIPHAIALVEELHLRAGPGVMFDAAGGVPEGFEHKTELGVVRMTSTAKDETEIVVVRSASIGVAAFPRAGFGALARLVGTYGGGRGLAAKLVVKK